MTSVSTAVTQAATRENLVESETKTGSPLTAKAIEDAVEIEQAIAHLTTGDFHSKWDHAKQFAQRFEHWGDRPIPQLIYHLHSNPDPENQWFLLRTLGKFDHPVVVETLASFLVTTSVEELQAEATKALTNLGSSAIARLTQLIASPSLESRILAARTLAKIRRSAVIEPLLSASADPDESLRTIAIEALGSFHDPRITPVLLAALSDKAPVATEAIRALGRRTDLLETVDLVGVLQRCLGSAEGEVAKESAIALGRLGSRLASEFSVEPVAESVAQVLGKLITQPAPTAVKIAAVRSLGWLDSPLATHYLVTAFDYPFPLVLPPVREEIVRSLGQTRSEALKPTAAQPLIAWLQHRQSGQTNELEAPHEEIHEEIHDIEQKVEQNIELEINERQTSLGDFILKQSILLALTRLNAIDAISSLIAALGDPDARIRMHALSALKQVAPTSGQSSIQDYLSTADLSLVSKKRIVESLTAW